MSSNVRRVAADPARRGASLAPWSTVTRQASRRAYGHGTGYGYATRDGVEIHISESDEHDPKRVPKNDVAP